VEVNGSGKHSSLLQYNHNNSQKGFKVKAHDCQKLAAKKALKVSSHEWQNLAYFSESCFFSFVLFSSYSLYSKTFFISNCNCITKS
jgi:hypothetical protein